MRWFAGVDGGQSSTVVAIGDEGGERGRGAGPPADLVGKPRDPAWHAHAIGAALAAARERANVPPDARISGLVAGISGYDAGESAPPDLAAYAERIAVVHDATIAHAGALGGAAGIVVIAGTGSVAVGNALPGGPLVRAGGWGFFFGDEGGAIWLARTALGRAMARHDRLETSELADRALAFFGALSLRAIQHAFAHGELTRPALATFATEVLASAAGGDADAVAVRDGGGRALAQFVASVDERLGNDDNRAVSYAGGLWRDAGFTRAFERALAETVPRATVREPALDAAAGALVLARRLGAEAASA